MKAENKNHKNNFDIKSIIMKVDSEVIEQVRDGRIRQISVNLTKKNEFLFLENSKGGLVLVTEELPDTFHGCYLYNDGKFPYVIRETLESLFLDGGEDSCLTKIIGVKTVPSIRFRFQDHGKPIVEDPDGDSCVWELQFEVVPVPTEPKTYLMRWNPAISSFKEKDFEECVANMVHGMFRLNWSIYEWQEARRGDYFYMLRTGDDKAGIVFSGQFLSDPYPEEDWAGTTKRRMYVDMVCMNPAELGAMPHISLEDLQKAIPGFEWAKGHSGALLPEDVAKSLDSWK